MAIKIDGNAPYAPARTVITIIDKNRRSPLSTVDAMYLERLGVQESLVSRTLATLRLLDFIDEQGVPDESFKGLASLTDSEYTDRLKELLKVAYEPVISIIPDLWNADPQQVKDAFRGFRPVGQIERMVQLFSGLMAHVGLMPEGKRVIKRPVPVRRTSARKGASPSTTNTPEPETQTDATLLTSPSSLPSPSPSKSEYRRSATIPGAGTITLVADDLNPLALTGEGRAFFFRLVDLIEEYNSLQAPGPSKAGNPELKGES